MIIKAKVVWEVPVTLDVDESLPSRYNKIDVLAKASDSVYLCEPKITECNELPEIVDKSNKETP